MVIDYCSYGLLHFYRLAEGATLQHQKEFVIENIIEMNKHEYFNISTVYLPTMLLVTYYCLKWMIMNLKYYIVYLVTNHL